METKGLQINNKEQGQNEIKSAKKSTENA